MLRIASALLALSFASYGLAAENLDLCRQELLTEISESLDKACYQKKLKSGITGTQHKQDVETSYQLSPNNRNRTIEVVKDLNRLQSDLDAFCLRVKTSTKAAPSECKGSFRSLQGQLQMITAEIGKNVPKLSGPNEKECQTAHRKVQELLNSQDYRTTTIRKQFREHYKTLCPTEFPKTLYQMKIKGGGIPATLEN